jgi:ornithine carbamoyltransferase
MKHFLNIIDLSNDELSGLLAEAARLKAAHARRIPAHTLAGRVVGLVFEKPSLRTRVSFESGVVQLGGTSLYLPGNEVGLGWRETLGDFSRTISQYVDALVLRVYRHETLDGLAAHSTIPIINALSDWSHPCQGLADLLTVRELFGGEAGRTVAFVGDGNNVAASLAQAVAMLGGRVIVASPRGFELPEAVRQAVATIAQGSGAVEVCNDPIAAVSQADAVYTDVWASMGQESEAAARREVFLPYQVNARLMAHAPASAIFMHCLPAHRGDEVTDEVMDSPASVVFDQSENRLHTQKALLALLAG